MTSEEKFDTNFQDTINRINHIISVKGKEYRRNNDPFHNFNQGSIITGNPREDIIWGFALKHFISIQDIKHDLKNGIIPTKEAVEEKYTDLIIYLIIEKLSILENIENQV